MTIAYCVKCKAKREMSNPVNVSIKGRGGTRKAVKGKCPKCGTGMYRIVG